MNSLWWLQIKAIVRLELRKTFFARRGIWIYLLAFAPVVLFFAQALVENHMRGESRDAAPNARRITGDELNSIKTGMTVDEVMAKFGPPYSTRVDQHKEILKYPTEAGELTVDFENNVVTGTESRGGVIFEEEIKVFAAVFQFFFIRLAVFFGCLGIFMNLIRGEMLDRTLHYYLLVPVRREVLVVGKYLAGLSASIVIFTTSAALQIFAISLAFDANSVHHFLYQEQGFAQISAYLGVTVLACVGYGSVFLGAGLLLKNPIIAAVLVLVWEAANPLLPSLMQKFSVIYYLKSMCPVQVPLDPGMPKLLALLVSNSQPVSGYVAVSGLIALAMLVLYGSALRARSLEINYTTE